MNDTIAKTSTAAGTTGSLGPNFITEIIDEDLRAGRYEHVVTRFPPEPNGYLHLGHATAICLNFSTARRYGGTTNLRFDDTNPAAEDMEYVGAIQRDIKWLGFDWGDNLFFASDYFERIYDCAVRLIQDSKAYVDSLSEADIRAYRGTVTEPGLPSPYRERSVEENLDLFARMKAGEFADGEHVLRAKIDMTNPNMKMRDPLLYRIRHTSHYRRGDAWCIYPMYDFAHPLSDAFEGVTHSLCTLEFVNNREVYDWLLDTLFKPPRPHQYEFGRHNIEYVVESKRKLIELVRGGYVNGWDDPRLPTLAGLRRRGVTPAAIRAFVGRIGVSRSNSSTSVAALEHSIRDDLNTEAPRVMAVLEPLKVVISDYPETLEQLSAPYWPHDVPKEGARAVPFSRELYLEREDFMEHPIKGFHRLSPGTEVRLRHAYVIRCDEVVKDASGNIIELHCSYDPDTLGKNPAGRKVKGTLHWVSAAHALPAEFRLYDRLFSVPNPEEGDEPFTAYLNPESLVVKRGFIEPSVANDPADRRYQFERQGYFWRDADSKPGALVFNRIVTLKDTWAKVAEAAKPQKAPAKKARNPRPQPEGGSGRDPLAPLSPEPRARAERYLELGLDRDAAALLASDAALAKSFEAALKIHPNPQGIANWLVNDLPREAKGRSVGELQLTPEHLAGLVRLVDAGTINSTTAKEVFAEMLGGEAPDAIVKRRGLKQLSDVDALEPIVERLIAGNPGKVERYREGKAGLLGFFVGQVMRETEGKANPRLVQELVKRKLA